MTREPRDAPQFYLTAPSPCPYLPDRQERKVFTHLIGRRAVALNDQLTQSGFRRSQTIAYRPACENCRACVSVRIKVDEFRSSRNFRRIAELNRDLVGTVARPEPTPRAIFAVPPLSRRAAWRRRHGRHDGSRLCDDDRGQPCRNPPRRISPVRRKTRTGERPLVAACLTDLLADGLSMVYSFYAPDEQQRSLGTYMILDHIERARRLGLPHVYLGYWVEGSRKMAYKARFLPQERLGMNGWERVE